MRVFYEKLKKNVYRWNDFNVKLIVSALGKKHCNQWKKYIYRFTFHKKVKTDFKMSFPFCWRKRFCYLGNKFPYCSRSLWWFPALFPASCRIQISSLVIKWRLNSSRSSVAKLWLIGQCWRWHVWKFFWHFDCFW